MLLKDALKFLGDSSLKLPEDSDEFRKPFKVTNRLEGFLVEGEVEYSDWSTEHFKLGYNGSLTESTGFCPVTKIKARLYKEESPLTFEPNATAFREFEIVPAVGGYGIRPID